MRQKRPTLPLALALTGFFIATAQPLAAQTLPRFDQQIVVTAARAESTIARVPAFVTLLDADDVRNSPVHNIPDLLRRAGVQVTDITGNGRSFRVDLRGFGATAGSNTLVLVDGRRVNQPDLSGSDWSQIPLDQVERIEVIRGGSGAVAFGDNATGGVVNIVTKSGGVPEARAAFRTGAYSTVAPEASARGRRGDVSYALSGRYQRSDGHRENAQTNGGDLSGNVVMEPSDAFSLGVSGGFHHDKTGLPGTLTETLLGSGTDRSTSVTPNDFADVDDGYVMATPKVIFGRGYATADVSLRQRNSLAFSTFVGGEFSGDTGIRTIAASPRFVWSAGTAVSHQVVAGADLSSAEEDLSNTLVLGGVPDVGRFTLEKTGQGLYVRDEVRAGSVTVSGGYRYDAVTYRFAPSTPSERDFTAHAGDVGATLRVTDAASVFAGLSRSFRYPVLDELFDFFSNTILTNLGPQSSIDLQGGVRVDAGAAQASLSVFRLSTDDEIFFNPAGGFGFGANENLDGDTRRTGVDLAVSAVARGVMVGGTLTFLETSVDGGRYDGQSIPGAASRRATVQARVPLTERLAASVDASFTGARRFEGDFDGEFGDQDSTVIVDARLTYQQGRSRLFMDLKNLFDEEYSEFGVIGSFPRQRAFYPSPGFHVFGGVDVSWGR